VGEREIKIFMYAFANEKEIHTFAKQFQTNNQQAMKANAYKLRAEGAVDAARFIGATAGKLSKFKMETIGHGPDVTLEFTTAHTQADIQKALAMLNDSHVMSQTLALKRDYTGERL
jgi:hypothetical protein